MPSSVIRKYAYEPSDRTLTITFVSGRHYRYQDVPMDVYEAMRLSFAKGEFFNKHIRDRFAHRSEGEGERDR